MSKLERRLEAIKAMANGSEAGKLAALNELAAIDADQREVREIAAILAELATKCGVTRSESKRNFAKLAQALARDCITYRTDVERVGREQIDGITDPYQPVSVSLNRGVDDCDAKARLFVALCHAEGIPA